jgi:hypothetical protein
MNRTMEGIAGKITTAQNASARNQPVTNRLAATALGLPADTVLDPVVIKQVKDSAGAAYDALGQAGQITPGSAYTQALDSIAAPFKRAAQGFPGAKPSPVIDLVESLKSPTFDAADAVAMVKQLRSGADDAFRTGNADVGRASKAAAKAIEDAIERHLQATGNTQMLADFRAGRQLYAKAVEVERAYNPTTGTVDAKKLGQRIKANKPLTGELRTAGEFANTFPKAAQTTEGMGSLPQTSPLDWIPAGVAAVGTQNPMMLAGIGLRPAMRAASLSGPVQNRLIPGLRQPNALTQMLADPDALAALYRAAPVTLAGR